PGLRRQVLDPADDNPGLLTNLAAHRFLRGLARLHIAGKAREAGTGAALVAAEQTVLAAHREHDRHRVGARVMLGPALRAAPLPAGLVDRGRRPALGAEAVPGVPADERARLGENRRLALRDLRRQGADIDRLGVPAGQHVAAGRVDREIRPPALA